MAKQLLSHMHIENSRDFTFFDVMVGGGSVALAVAKSFPHASLHINDLDANMCAFWSVVAAGTDADFTSLVRRLNVQPTLELFQFLLVKQPEGTIDRAFRAMFFNRASYITAIGKRPLGGKKQAKDTISSRWNYEQTVKHMLATRKLLHGRTTVSGEDFDSVLPLAKIVPGFVYCDPPYYKAGNELYHTTQWRHSDHVRLWQHLSSMDNWLLSYDDHPAVRNLYTGWNIGTIPMKYSAGGKRKKLDELLIKSEEETLWQEQQIATGENQISL